ncbi:hypothetical protein QPK24_15670 [Paenibacillus polygoni]|uniref:Uncharacterized protein n=1 Tax=Paenibacillus polygoni TaxID=3050112 RepID=A0ABY8X319_9BACL|nr:hypothetical protein [Paenibacillus polygoni]WIV17846.1 hypothetical protein QPK24_15670 [Paenibacillus polygoni]
MKVSKKVISDAAIKKSETAIRKAFNAVDTAEFTAHIVINDETQNIPIKNVSIEFLIGKPSIIRINCKNDKDADTYKNTGLTEGYTVEEAKFEYIEIRDFQSTYRALVIKPIITTRYITIRLRNQN